MTPQQATLHNRVMKSLSEDLGKIMAKEEIVKRTLDPLKNLWWRFMPGEFVHVKWPSGWTKQDQLGNQVRSTDPNDHYRPYLEENVGRQGWDWDWRLDDGSINGLTIKIRRDKRKYASIIGLMWQ